MDDKAFVSVLGDLKVSDFSPRGDLPAQPQPVDGKGTAGHSSSL
jgi:hypothetical protein